MTTVTTIDRNTMVANGTAALPFTFQALSATEVGVLRNGVPQVGGFTVTLNGDSTGSVQPTASWGTDTVTIFSDPNYAQPANFTRFGAFYPDQFVPPIDRLARTAISLRGRLGIAEANITDLQDEDDVQNNAIGANASAIAQEVSDRTDAVSGEAAARQSADATNALAITNEIAARTAAVNSEQASRIAGDNALQVLINNEAALRSAADGAFAGAASGLTNAIVNAASRSILIGLNTAFAAGITAQLNEGVRVGPFLPLTALDYTARTGRTLLTDIGIDNAVLNGFKGNIILPVGNDYTGASGAWVYPWWVDDVSGRLFGATDGADLKAPLEAWANVVWNLPAPSATWMVDGIAALPISIGNANGCLSKRVLLSGTINATAVMDILLTIRKPSTLDLNVGLWGNAALTTGQAWNSRLAGYGLRLTDCQNARITGKITANNFKFWGVIVDDSIGVNSNNSNYAMLPYIRANSCGISNSAGGGSAMSATWNTPSRSGVSASINQTTSIITSAAPTVDAIEGTSGWLFWISGQPYAVKNMTGTGPYTLTLYAPWLNDTLYNSGAGSGTGFFTVGGGFLGKGTDANIMPVEGVFATNCGYVMLDSSAYGITARRLSTDGNCDVLYGFGRFTNAAHYGGGFDELYVEGTSELAQVLSVGPTASQRKVLGKFTGQGVDFSKWFKLAPIATAGGDANKLYYQEMNEIDFVPGYAAKRIIAGYGPAFNVSFDPPSLAPGATTTVDVSIPAQLTVGTKIMAEFFGAHGYETNGYIVANDVASSTARISLTSRSGSTIDDPSATLRVTLIR